MEWKGTEGSEGEFQYQYGTRYRSSGILYSTTVYSSTRGATGKHEQPVKRPKFPTTWIGAKALGELTASALAWQKKKKKKVPDPTSAKTAPIPYLSLN